MLLLRWYNKKALWITERGLIEENIRRSTSRNKRSRILNDAVHNIYIQRGRWRLCCLSVGNNRQRRRKRERWSMISEEWVSRVVEMVDGRVVRGVVELPCSFWTVYCCDLDWLIDYLPTYDEWKQWGHRAFRTTYTSSSRKSTTQRRDVMAAMISYERSSSKIESVEILIEIRLSYEKTLQRFPMNFTFMGDGW